MHKLLIALALLGAGLIPTAGPADARTAVNTIGAGATLIGDGHAARGTVLLACTAGQ